MDIADSAALLFTPTYVDSVESISNPLELPVSLLVRDMQPREYDFIVSIDSSGVHLPATKYHSPACYSQAQPRISYSFIAHATYASLCYRLQGT